MSVPRLLRSPEGEPILEWRGRGYDLLRWSAAQGLPTELVPLLASGALSAPRLASKLPGEGDDPWVEVPLPRTPLLPPLLPREVGKVLCLGKNFRAHAAEFGEEVPEEPLFFAKLPETLTGSGATVVVRSWFEGRVDHEAELALVIGQGGADLSEDTALEHVAAWTIANDLTARTLQGADRKKGYPWLRGKNMDGFLPLGPALVPAGFLDPHALQVTCTVNGEVRQDANTRDLVVGIGAALAYLSKHLTLNPGDLVLMGTPEGVGPLQDGDQVSCSIDPIGHLNTILHRPR